MAHDSGPIYRAPTYIAVPLLGPHQPRCIGLTLYYIIFPPKGASEPRNMAYMTRLGLWGTGTPFPEFNDFIQAIEKRGVGAMELVAMDMKLRGMYIARQLSFHGVSFRVEEIPVPKDFLRVYNSAVKLVSLMFSPCNKV